MSGPGPLLCRVPAHGRTRDQTEPLPTASQPVALSSQSLSGLQVRVVYLTISFHTLGKPIEFWLQKVPSVPATLSPGVDVLVL